MSSTNLPTPTNKRVLSERSPNEPSQSTISKKQRLLYSQMLPPDRKFESKIPAPKYTTTITQSSVQDPQTSTPTRNSPSFPKDYQQTVLSIKDRLARKSSLNDPSTFLKPKPPQTKRPSGGDIQEKYYALNEECKNVSSEVDQLTRELAEIKRKSKSLQYKVDDATDEVQLMRDRFQFTEESVVKKVADEEKLMFLKSQESQMKLENHYKELEFEMKNQLEEAKSFDNQFLLDKIEELKTTEQNLAEEIEKLKSEKEQLLMSEQHSMEQELQKRLSLVKQDQEKSSDELQVANEKKKLIQSKFTISKEYLDQQQANLQKLKSEIGEVEASMSIFLSEKESLLSELSTIESNLDAAKEIDEKEQSEFNSLEQIHSKALAKMYKHDTHRRILENSIMDYEGKIRVYVVSNEEETKEIQSRGKLYEFNKQFPKNIPASVIADEFSCLLKSSLRGSNVSIINTAHSIPTSELVLLTYNHISDPRSSTKNRQFTIRYQCISIQNLQVFDNLDSKKNVSSQGIIQQMQASKIQIEDKNHIESIVQTIPKQVEQELVVHLFSVETGSSDKQYETTVMIVDLGNIQRPDQMELLQTFKLTTNSDSPTTKIFSFARYNSKCLFLGSADSDYDYEYLDELQLLNSMDSLYKPKS
ncbi:uncharacterized protein SPAPADRAFT_51539 [Spathaspora passalidarum NRRL Y-27907]|uniref:Spindle pole body-associated protein Vik1/Cik1 microtubule binding domain-containing protein n=1 Tax=Spathaspora passalidarum (strain NRRL Y-27907 / 11-Y1) TaxID=619300 RepID=G3AQI9_SPAPN|nr:uncharacterized protein SPAPADRAFT_51539 [Spathaspora passalidarum NRRL Y-27907]EGW31536.1 hypothetical protein SPAPADRAFT_51539 [Spathaspora passalidarum NRRL Y-27907]